MTKVGIAIRTRLRVEGGGQDKITQSTTSSPRSRMPPVSLKDISINLQ